MATMDKSTSFLKPGNRWVVKGGKKIGQVKKGSGTPNTSLAGRASTNRSGFRVPKNSDKGTGGSGAKAPTVSSAGSNVAKRLRAGNFSGALTSAKNLKVAVKNKTSETISKKKKAVKSAYEKVDTKQERKAMVQTFKTRGRQAIFGKVTGKGGDRKGGAINTAKAWGSAAQKAAIKKLAEFNRGRKRGSNNNKGGGGK